MKRFISMLLSMFILFSTLITPLSAIPAPAESGSSTSEPLVSESVAENVSEGFDFALNDDGQSYSVTGRGDCTDTALVIPSTYNGLPVTGIGGDSFWCCTDLTSVIIPDGVTSIGSYAFAECTNLTSVTIPDSVTSIGRNAFAASGLTSVTIPDSVTSLGYAAFANCYSLASATLGSGVTSMESSLFRECTSLTSVTIPDSVTSIGDYAFYLCSSLELITIPDGVTSIGSAAFQYCYGLTSMTVPDNVTRIGDYAFADCTGLTSIAIPDSVTIMENNVFFDCTNLTDIYCEAESQPSGWYSEWLHYCDAVVHWGVDFVDSDTEPVGTEAPETESSDTAEETTDETTAPETESTETSSPIRGFDEVEMPAEADQIWSSTYNYYVGVNQLNNPVGSWSWANTFDGKDGCWGLHNGVESLDCNLKTIFWKIEDNDYLNKGVTAVKEIVFADIYNQSGLGDMGHIRATAETFEKMTVIYSDDGENWSSVGFTVAYHTQAGNFCDYFGNDYPIDTYWHLIFDKEIHAAKYFGIHTSESASWDAEDHVPALGIVLNLKHTYLVKGSASGNAPETEPVVTEPIETASEGLEFALNGDGQSYSVTGLGTCTDIDIVIPSIYNGYPVTSIGGYAFSGCTGLTSVTIPNSATSIGKFAFLSCTALTSVIIPDGVTSIGEGAFNACTSLISVAIPDSVTSMGTMVFADCLSLINIYCEAESVPFSWDPYWDYGCNATVHWGWCAHTDCVWTVTVPAVGFEAGERAQICSSCGETVAAETYYNSFGLDVEENTDKTLTGIGEGVSPDELVAHFGSLGYEVVITDADGNAADYVGTGIRVIFVHVVYVIVVKGDVTGDGVIDIFDLVELLDFINGDLELEGVFQKAGLVVNEEEPDIFDLVAILDHINGDYPIEP